jgi:hypothetical protein
MEPYFERLRSEYAPTAYVNMEFVIRKSPEAQRRLETVRKRLKAMAAK